MEDLAQSINQYEDQVSIFCINYVWRNSIQIYHYVNIFLQLAVVKQALETTQETSERESLLALQSELEELIKLTRESLDVQKSKTDEPKPDNDNNSNGLDDEYALFMVVNIKSV